MKSTRVLLSGLVLAMTISAPLTLDARGGPRSGEGQGTAAQNQNGAGQPAGLSGGMAFMHGQGNADGAMFQARRHHGSPEFRARRIFRALDLDESDSLTLDELLARPASHWPDRFDRMDADDDGLISRDEYLNAHERFDEMDIDIDALHACVAEQMGSGWTGPADRETRFDEMDTNDDGFVDQDEFVAARESAIEERFNLIDADGDGAISLEELIEALERRRERHAIRRDCIDEQREISELLDG
jgi:Ca2+-binding EF-hand superfamily protein